MTIFVRRIFGSINIMARNACDFYRVRPFPIRTSRPAAVPLSRSGPASDVQSSRYEPYESWNHRRIRMENVLEIVCKYVVNDVCGIVFTIETFARDKRSTQKRGGFFFTS